MKLLIATLYFPPAAGGGVQRPLKLAEHLAALGADVFVLAPDDARWLHRDTSVALPADVRVHRARYIGPAARIRARELRGKRRGARLAAEARSLPRRLLVPDAAVLWNATAVPTAIRLVRRNRVDVIVTSSPPDSIHLLGWIVKQATQARWVADVRDPIIASPFRRRDVRGEATVARLVVRHADAVVAATRGVADELRTLDPRCPVEVIESGCDFDDVRGLAYHAGPRFRITHTGSFFTHRRARPFLDALALAGGEAVARFVGEFRDSDIEYAEALGLGSRLEVIPYVPRATALALQRASDALLLLVGDGGRGRPVLTSKVFEYLAAARPILAAAPLDGDAAELVSATGAGTVVAPDDVEGLTAALVDLESRWGSGGLDDVALPPGMRERLSRRRAAERLLELATRVVR